jgi:antitoxin MazE
MSTTIQKWGNSLGVRLPSHLARRAKLREGTPVEVTAEADRIIIQPVAVPSLDELVSRMDPDSRPELADWGAPVGKEVW